ncbi:MAG TPA: Holliday junction resolvase RuvX [Candidatus Polarisedimenticolaceae bacterium]|nr:Holliday junction resolvase RuvX [Candidatus Polarisedimenticolaceae bacterium]
MTDGPGRVLALDLGSVRVGLALSDPLRLTAQPAGYLARRELRRSLEPVLTIIRAQEVGTVVVGRPLLLSGEAGDAARDAEAFAARLRERAPCPVALWDERLTTVQAERALLEGDVRRAKRREVIDAAAAAILLQSWLDREGQRVSSST